MKSKIRFETCRWPLKPLTEFTRGLNGFKLQLKLSIEIEEILSANLERLFEWNRELINDASIYWVPLISPNPSFDAKLILSSLYFFNIVLAFCILPLCSNSPSPIIGNDMWANGAKSPEAPKEPYS